MISKEIREQLRAVFNRFSLSGPEQEAFKTMFPISENQITPEEFADILIEFGEIGHHAMQLKAALSVDSKEQFAILEKHFLTQSQYTS